MGDAERTGDQFADVRTVLAARAPGSLGPGAPAMRYLRYLRPRRRPSFARDVVTPSELWTNRARQVQCETAKWTPLAARAMTDRKSRIGTSLGWVHTSVHHVEVGALQRYGGRHLQPRFVLSPRCVSELAVFSLRCLNQEFRRLFCTAPAPAKSTPTAWSMVEPAPDRLLGLSLS